MGKASRENRNPQGPPVRNEKSDPQGLMRFAVLAGVVALIVIGVVNYRESRELRRALDARFAQIDQKIGQVATKVDAVASAGSRRSGPDPNRVYTIKTEGSPAEGSATAPVTIAEFSDFQ